MAQRHINNGQRCVLIDVVCARIMTPCNEVVCCSGSCMRLYAHTFCLQQNYGRIIVVGTARTSPGVRLLVKSVVRGLRAHQQPEASAEGLGGTYFFLNEAGSKASHTHCLACLL